MVLAFMFSFMKYLNEIFVYNVGMGWGTFMTCGKQAHQMTLRSVQMNSKEFM